MKNKIIEEQLKKCNVVDLSNYDASTNTYIIPQVKQIKLEVDSCYLVYLHKVLFDKNSSSVLISNWNRGTMPSCEYMKIVVHKILGKMINVTGIGFNIESKEDINIVWSGWLPIQDIDILERI